MTQTFGADLEAGAFDALFDRVIAPAVAPHEAERQRRVSVYYRWIAAATALSVVVAAYVWSRTHSFADAFQIVFAGSVGSMVVAYFPLRRFQTRCKGIILGDLCKALGLTFQGEKFDPPAFRQIEGLSLLPDHDRAEFEDLFGGERQGCAFQLYEAKLTKLANRSRRTVFQGQIARVAFPKRFLGVTVVAREGFRVRPPKGLERVGLESSEFERAFEVYGSDQVEARYLVHPAFMARLIDLETAAAGQRIRCAFEGGDLLIAMEGGDLFEVVDAFKPIPDRAAVRKGLEEIEAVLKLIGVVLDPPRPQFGAAS
jgi:hypothetical protein